MTRITTNSAGQTLIQLLVALAFFSLLTFFGIQFYSSSQKSSEARTIERELVDLRHHLDMQILRSAVGTARVCVDDNWDPLCPTPAPTAPVPVTVFRAEEPNPTKLIGVPSGTPAVFTKIWKGYELRAFCVACDPAKEICGSTPPGQKVIIEYRRSIGANLPLHPLNQWVNLFGDQMSPCVF